MRLMRRMWITVEVTDARFRKAVCDEIRLVVEKMSGDFVKSSSLDSLFVLAMLPHRKYKTLEKAVAAALTALPVGRTIVNATRPKFLS
jgi:hypothetical protein